MKLVNLLEAKQDPFQIVHSKLKDKRGQDYTTIGEYYGKTIKKLLERIISDALKGHGYKVMDGSLLVQPSTGRLAYSTSIEYRVQHRTKIRHLYVELYREDYIAVTDYGNIRLKSSAGCISSGGAEAFIRQAIQTGYLPDES